MSRRKKSHQSHGTTHRPRLWGRHAVTAALDNPDRKILRAWATRDAAAYMQFPKEVVVTIADVADLGRLVPNDAPHQGVVVEVEPLADMWLDGLLHEAPERAVLLVLDQVTDPHNVGAILRTACAFGADALVTTQRYAPRETGVMAKSASGALDLVPLIEVRNLGDTLELLKTRGMRVLGFDSEAPSPLVPRGGTEALAIVLGAEGKGLRQRTRELCDEMVRLDMPGPIKSLNVSNAAAIALYAATTARG